MSSPNAGPIADLTYRTYDGSFDPPSHRWRVIAKMTAERTLRNKWYWLIVFLSGWYFWVMMIGLFVVDQMMQTTGGDAGEALEMLQVMDWPGHFLHGFRFGQLGFMLIALIAGAGAIANDNRSNALLVYLSKPCTKADYLIGKWVGIYLPLLCAMALPAAFFYLFGVMNYRDYGFVADDPWIPFRVFGYITISAAFYTSIVLGVSSLFNQGRMAGATFAGIYLISNFLSVMMTLIIFEAHDAPARMIRLAESAYYLSIPGLAGGIAKLFLNLDEAPMFIGAGSGVAIDRPSYWLAFGGLILLSGLAMLVANKRVRAVEVVK